MAKMHKRIIGLITDFGAKGQHYISSIKGVILKINPEINIIDIAHNITPFSIIEAAYVIKTIYKHYPKETVFIIVVDPGVGSSREILGIETIDDYYFVGPNNGIFLNVFPITQISKCIDITNAEYFNNPVSNLFHGRDIMAPVGAYIANGVDINTFGIEFDLNKIAQHPIEYKKISDKEIRCTIQYIDNFGNITTNIVATSISLEESVIIKIKLKNKTEISGKFVNFFEEGSDNTFLFLVGSSGYLEISKNQGNAASDLDLKVGDVITVEL